MKSSRYPFLKKYIQLSALLFILFLVMLPHRGNSWDMDCWKQWANYIFENSLGEIYHSNTDYLPLYHYVLLLFGFIQGSVAKIGYNIHYLKLITLLFHFVTGFFLALLIKKPADSWEKVRGECLFYLLNIAILYNTLIWGQVDAILTCFIFISCYFAYQKKVLHSLIFIILAINFKLQAIVFLPVIGLMLLPVIIYTFSKKRILQWLLGSLLLQVLIIMPFILAGTCDKLWNVVTGSVGKWPFVSISAYNVWDFFLSGELNRMPDSITLLGISYKSWGLIMFFVASGIALWPMAKLAYTSLLQKSKLHIPLEIVLITCAIIPLLFFYFNTQMHERYTHPALVFLVAYGIYTKRPVVPILGCLAYFLNLESIIQFMHKHEYRSLIFNRTFISSLYLITIAGLYFDLFRFKIKKDAKNEGSLVNQ